MSRSTTNWLFVAAMVVAGVVLAHPTYMLSAPRIDFEVDAVGAGVAAVGLLIRVVARDWKIRYGGSGLVTSGPYSVVRHPLYVGSFLTGLGLCIIFGSLPFIALFVVCFTALHAAVARREERDLMRLWPEQYRKYAASVNGWLPSLNGLLHCGRECLRCIGWRSISRELSAVCGIAAGAAMLDLWSDCSVEGWLACRTEAVVLCAIATTSVLVWVLAFAYQRHARRTA